MDNLDDAQDVLQETLLDAWLGIGRLRDPGKVRAWLLQVARNRCLDYHRKRRRLDLPMDDRELHTRIDRLSLVPRHNLFAEEAVQALEQVPAPQAEIARLFYLEGLTISEIAERHRCPEGTVKRRLFDARDQLRRALGVEPQRRMDMSTSKDKARRQPFPDFRPEIKIAPLEIEPFTVDCLELKWWSIIPAIGNKAGLAEYYLPDWKVDAVRQLSAVRQAWIHEVEGVEVEMRTWERETGWRDSSHSFFGRIRDDAVQWLGGMYRGEDTQVRTFLDEGFVWAFPDVDRKLKDDGLFETLPDGALRTNREHEDITWSGAGCFSVGIGERSFKCLRVIGLEGPLEASDTAATEIFVSDAGRTVLIRHYCRPEAAAAVDREMILDESMKLTIDGETLTHWYDTLTDTACGNLSAL